MKPLNERLRQTRATGRINGNSPDFNGRPKKTIAIGLVESLDDIVACEPVSRYLRGLFPMEHLVWCVREEYRALIDSNPHIDETYVVSCLTEWQFLAQSRVFDELFDLHLIGRSCPVCGIPHQKQKGNLSITTATAHHFGSRLSACAQGAGLPALNNDPRVYISETVRTTVDRLGLPDEFVVVHCNANDPAGAWSAERWRELAALIRTGLKLPVVEIGAHAITNDPAVIGLCGRLSILEMAEVIRRATVFIGADSAPVRLAHAVRTFGVVLLEGGSAAPRSMPYSGEYGNGINAELVFAQGAVATLSVRQIYEVVQKNLVFASRQKESKRFVDTAFPDSVHRPSAAEGKKARVIAFYLPQFHPIPENDAWGGKGFTEWTNVTKAQPLFPGHYQPHLPGELGFYDLRVPEARKAQADLARAHGIEGFCYWHYWFGNGKRLLERPFQEVLELGEPDFPFCLAWANETWTARWYGTEKNVIQLQEYPGAHDDEAHFNFLLKAFLDRRYITIDGKPVFAIYYPGKLPDVKATIALWRRLAREHGLPGIFFIALKTMYGAEAIDWREHGFDAVLHHMPDFRDVNAQSLWRRSSMAARREHYPNELIPLETVKNHFDYTTAAAFMKRKLDEVMTGPDSFATVVCSWDNTPRYGERATILDETSPGAFGRWLEAEVARVSDRDPDRRVIFINAWNEWAEGMHLEPDQKHGRAFLQAAKCAVAGEGQADLSRPKCDRIGNGPFMSAPLADLLALFEWECENDQSGNRTELARAMVLHAVGEFSRNFHAVKSDQSAATVDAYHRSQRHIAAVFGCYAEALIGQGQFAQADESLQLALNLNKDAVVISKPALLSMAKHGYAAAVLPVLSNLINKTPNNPELLHGLAEALLGLGERQKALGIYSQILARNPNDRAAIERCSEITKGQTI